MKDNDSICLETGNYLINNAKSIANKHFGFSIKKVIYSNNKEEKKVAELDYEIQNLFLSNYAFETSEDLLRLSLYDENLANFWLESFKQYNEIEANHRAIEEVERLSSDPDYNPCPTTID
ncbi:MAG: hypothetical protein OEY19_12080 [Gammaproteobacteria bacterium]|nr:hypothetical protein [Gammaproteobacteria bacterium]